MSVDNNKLDELFRNKFENVELPVSDKLLANIKKELEPKRKRRFGFWIWLLSGLIFITGTAGAIYYFYNKNVETQLADSTVITNVEPIAPKNAPDKNKVDIENEDKSAGKVGPSKDSMAEIVAENKTLKSASSNQLQSKENNFAQNKHAKEKSPNISSKERNNNSAAAKPTKSESTETMLPVAQQGKPKKTKKQKQSDQPVAEKGASGKNSGASEYSSLKESKTEASENTAIIENKAADAEKTKTSEADKKLFLTESAKQAVSDSLEAKKDTIVADTKKKTDTVKQSLIKDPIKENAEPRKFSFFAEINGGASQSFRTLTFESAYQSDSRNNEKPLATYNGGIDVGVLFKDKYQVSVGLGIDKKGEKYSYRGQDAQYHTTDTSYYVYDTIIDSVQYIDSTYITDTHTEQTKAAIAAKSGHNSYQYIKLPIMFGYRFNLGEKWFITPNAGVVVNYLIKAQATWFDAETQQYITYSSRNLYNPLVLAARAKIDIGFNINEKWSILLQPGYTRFLQSIYRKEEHFKQYPYSYDLNIAVRYKF
jgi:hypothetical protein